MSTLPTPDYIEFLVARKFPELREPYPSPIAKRYGFNDGIYEDEEPLLPVTDEVFKKSEEYRQELENLPQKQVRELYDQEYEKQLSERDRRRFFHQKKADADCDHWSRMPYWSLDEAIALSFGKDPEVVFLGRMKGIMSYLSPFVNSYRKLHEVAGRAVSVGELTDPVKPADFIAWAERNNVPIPARMKEILASRAPVTSAPDWRKLYEELSEKSKTSIEDLQAQVDALAAALEESQADKLESRERTTIHKILLGAIIKGYGYDPNAKKSPAIPDLVHDIELLGLSVDQDTVRRWIKNALPFLPRDALTKQE
ncbi:MAG: hypothetical protein LRZ85_08545 [Alphaproteobacteria bacterium]|nr:hypothetical protein [Alphaproteobacteria bacterium]